MTTSASHSPDQAPPGRPARERLRGRPARLAATAALTVALAVALGVLFGCVDPQSRAEVRAVAAVRAEKLANWTPEGGEELWRSVAGRGDNHPWSRIRATATVRRDIAIPADQLTAAMDEVLAVAEADGWENAGPLEYYDEPGTSEVVRLFKDGWGSPQHARVDCECMADISVGPAVPAHPDGKDTFTGISIHISGWSAKTPLTNP